ncbi:hypothetical protein GCAAIG_01010 [Candidatus Electronema halotolerans]
MLAHIIVDDKFIDSGLNQFEIAAPNQNIPIFIGKKCDLNYVRNKDVLFMDNAQIQKFVRSDKCSAIIFHSLPNIFLPIIKYAPNHIKKIWLGWGYDYYNRLLSSAFPDGFYLDGTKSLMVKKIIQRFAHRTKLSIKNLLKNDNNLLSQIDYFIPVIDLEYKLVAELNPWFKAKYICWNYGSAEENLLSDNKYDDIGDDILVGNSASATNNHLDTFILLKNNFDIENRKIIVPLSYGDTWYRDQIIKNGRRMFGDKFVPIVNFLPKNEYIDLLNRCGYVFMNHLRQQALGNICIMMLKGARIYLNSVNPLYRWFIDREGIVNNIYDDNIMEPLNAIQRKNNIDIVMNFCSMKVQRAKTRHLVDIAFGKEI